MKKTSNRLTVVILGVIVVLIIAVNIIGIRVSVGDTAVKAVGALNSIEFPVADMAEVTLKKDVVIGSRAVGGDFFGIKAGSFVNEEFGSYRAAIYAYVHDYVAVRLKDDSYVLLNSRSADATKALYEKLLALCPPR